MKKRKKSFSSVITKKELTEILKHGFQSQNKKTDEIFFKIGKRLEKMDKEFEKIADQFLKIDKHFDELAAQYTQEFARIDDNFLEINKGFKKTDENFAALNGKLDGKLAAYFGVTNSNIDKVKNDLEEVLHKEILQLNKSMDAFLKRTEKNEQEITFLGRQHDDLAKYCTEKIQYPTYGRKL